VNLLLALLLWPAAHASATPTFVKESGVRVTSGAVQGVARAFAAPQRVYYVIGSSMVVSATTTDGVTFIQENGVRLSSNTLPALDIAVSSITGVTVFPITGGWRMLYSVIGTTGSYRIYSATSATADGLGWANETGTVVNAGATFAGFPTVVQLTSGDRRLYYIQNSIAGNQTANHQIFTALSSNEGRNWSAGVVAVAAQAGEVSATKLTKGRVRVYYSAPVDAAASSNTIVNSALSSDVLGTSFALEGTRLSTTSALASPFVTISTDTHRWRMYYTYLEPQISTGGVYSATTESPDPQSVAPSTVFNTAASVTLTISGEIFAAGTVNVVLRGSGQPDIVGSNVTVVDDQTITADFATNGAPAGLRDLIVQSPGSLLAGTLSNALLIDFPGGSVQLTDNLFRPRNGQSVRIDVTSYNAGHITSKLYTLDGRFISTLFDSDQTPGTFTLTWDGRTSGGKVAASGVYLVRTTGPKLDNISKIILIK
jgi:hypothetical protein